MRVSVMVERRGELRHAVVVEVRSNLKLNNNVEGRDRPRRFIGRIRLLRSCCRALGVGHGQRLDWRMDRAARPGKEPTATPSFNDQGARKV